MNREKRYDLHQIALQTGIGEELLLRFIQNEWIIPAEPSIPAFDEEDLARVRLIFQLQADFGVNDEAVPIILHLLDQLTLLRQIVEKGAA